MQAIISDIIVSQALQSGNLQVSQLTQNNSSSQTSFADILNSLRTGTSDQTEKDGQVKTSYDDNKVEEVSKKAENQNPKVEKSDEKLKDDSVKEKADSKELATNEKEKSALKVDEKGKSLSLHKEAGDKTKQLKNADQPDKKIAAEDLDSKNPGKAADAKNLKKVFDKENQIIDSKDGLLDEETSADTEMASQIAGALNLSDSNINIKSENNPEESQVELDTESLSLTEDDSLFQNKLTADEKLYALDKDSKILVYDQRSQSDESKSVEKNPSKNQLHLEYDAQNNASVTMEMGQQNAAENILSLDNQTAASDGSNFQAMLNNQIQANAPEFVKAGSLILQDNNKGTINLVLHPDDLGNVKIHLSMDGKTISAHITVNTKEALEVFKDNAQTLREAFAKNGFDTANFDVSYNGNSNGQAGQDFKDLYDGSQFMARNAYSDFLGGGNDDGYIQDSYEFAENSEYSINIVA